ncbi:osteocrin isoform X2 [Maylandia zebra]|uniref:osteocrin isoform X2 n=1 Tax=Maylandia zebra TaxID=106582 RepID=UPI00403C856F
MEAASEAFHSIPLIYVFISRPKFPVIRRHTGSRVKGQEVLKTGQEALDQTHTPFLGYHVDQPILRFHAAPQSRPVGVKVGEELTAKLLQSDHLMRMENDVMEPKRKRSFPINNVPLDRLSISSMETKQQGSDKQSKVVESPRRRLNPPPIDRIGMGRLPNGRG